MRTIGHHACSNEGGMEQVLLDAPFEARYDFDNGKYQFLGSGYYFWDDNIEYAIYWGKRNYPNGCFVVASELNLTNDTFLDLVGNRGDMRYFVDLMKQFSAYARNDARTIGGVLELAKEFSIVNPEFFPFKSVRAIDLRGNEKFATKFALFKENYTILNPKLVICLYEKDELVLRSKEIVYKSR